MLLFVIRSRYLFETFKAGNIIYFEFSIEKILHWLLSENFAMCIILHPIFKIIFFYILQFKSKILSIIWTRVKTIRIFFIRDIQNWQ